MTNTASHTNKARAHRAVGASKVKVSDLCDTPRGMVAIALLYALPRHITDIASVGYVWSPNVNQTNQIPKGSREGGGGVGTYSVEKRDGRLMFGDCSWSGTPLPYRRVDAENADEVVVVERQHPGVPEGVSPG